MFDARSCAMYGHCPVPKHHSLYDPMDAFRTTRGGLLIGLLLVCMVGVGCDDAMLDAGMEGAGADETTQATTKLRHAELLEQAMRVSTSFEGDGQRLASASSDTTVGLIIALSNPSY